MSNEDRAVASEGREAVAYDFRRPNRVSKDRLRTIQAIFDRLVSSFGQVFQQRLRSSVQIELEELAQMTFGEYTHHLNKPCSAFIYRLGDIDESEAVLEFGSDLPFHVIDRLFGGSGDAYAVVRALSSTERNAFIEQVVGRMMSLFADAWQDHIAFAPVFKEFEFTPEVMEVALREDPVLVAVFRIRVHNLDTTFSLCLPIAAIESFLALSGNGRVAAAARNRVKSSDADRKAIEQHLREAQVCLSARLPVFRLPMRLLPQVVPGATLHTGISLACDLEIVAGARPHFRGRPQRSGSLLALEITHAFLDAEEASGREPVGRILPAEGEAPVGTTSGIAPGPLQDMALPVVVEIGRATLRISQVLRLMHGEVLEIDQFAGEPCVVYIGGRRYAEGEVVECGEHFGVRIHSLATSASGDAVAESLPVGASSGQMESLVLPVDVEVGRAWLYVSQILRLGRGAQIELDRHAEAPSDIVVGGRRVALGEVVQLHEHFGVRVISRADDPRLDSLPEIVIDSSSLPGGVEGDLSKLHDLALPITVTVGRTRLPLARIRGLEAEELLPLNRFAGEPCEIAAGGQRIAEGEVVQIGERFGVKFTNVISPRSLNDAKEAS